MNPLNDTSARGHEHQMHSRSGCDHHFFLLFPYISSLEQLLLVCSLRCCVALCSHMAASTESRTAPRAGGMGSLEPLGCVGPRWCLAGVVVVFGGSMCKVGRKIASKQVQ